MEYLNKSALLVLHNINNHANELVLQTAAAMEESALTAQASASHGSVLALLTHMLTSEFYFLARSEGKPVNPKSAPDKSLSLQEVALAFSQVANERLKYLNWINDDQLQQDIDIPLNGGDYKLPRWQLLAQSLFHSAHHRGELSIVMTALGHPLPTLDPIIPFINGSGQHWPED